jgi:predicted transglutaminase-like cysteine proteinase
MIKIATLKKIFGMIAFFGSAATAIASPASMQVTGPSSPPMGHVQFCSMHAADCAPYDRPSQVVRLTDAAWTRLQAVNTAVNTAVLPATDAQIYGVVERWDYPRLAGDCEDYAIEKRRELIAAGWPESALLLTVVRDEVGDGHAVLTVRTNRGDLVLDNKTDDIAVWSATPYRFLKRQSTRDAAAWDQIQDGRDTLVGSVGRN